MALNVKSIIDAVHTHLITSVPQEVFKQGVPDADDLPRDISGKVPYYIAVQYGTPWAKARGKGFCGVRHDEYLLPISLQVVGPDANNVETIAMSVVLDALLGFATDNTGQMEQRAGGSVVPFTSSTAATEAYIFPMGFGLPFQMQST